MILHIWDLKPRYDKFKHKKKPFVLITAVLLVVGIGATLSENTKAQMSNSNLTNGGAQTQTDTFEDLMTGNYQPHTNATTKLNPSLSEAIAEHDKISLVDASIIAEKTVGANAHAEKVRLGVWSNGELVYFALVIDNNNHFHGVVVDARDGKVIESGKNSWFILML